MASGADVVRTAKSQLGLSGASRYGGKAGEAWCSYFVTWCARKAGVKATIVPKKPRCDDLRAYYIADGFYHPRSGYTPRVGDIICFHWGDAQDAYAHVQHVGLVSGVDQTYVYTVEGNAGLEGKVCAFRYRRNAYSILGYCSPAYEEKSGKSKKTGGSASSRKLPITETNVAVVEEHPVITRVTADGRVVPTTPKSGVLTIAITAEGNTFTPKVLAGASLSHTQWGAGVLNFEVLPGGNSFFEGSRVYAASGETPLFYGYVFSKTRDEDGVIRVTAYDSLRYFKNKDTYIYENKTASALFSAICRDHGIAKYHAEESGVTLPYRVEDNNTLLDIMEYALCETEKKSGVRYVLRDEAGTLTLRRAKASGVVLDEHNITGFSYTSSIDGSLNRVKTVTEGDGVRNIRLVQDSESISRFGLLQTVLKQREYDLNAARELLNSKAGVRRKLKLQVRGDTRLLAGDTVVVRGVWGDVTLNNEFYIASSHHVWDGTHHSTTVTLEGGDFDA
ncbi:MAG: CHAP domain-containing protein [Oscillospiraceae bacterium]|nr:CHAP domain-containing protein [Oscillospiraceae bacterium]